MSFLNKKILGIVALIFFINIALGACGNSEPQKDAKTDGTAKVEEVKQKNVTIIFCDASWGSINLQNGILKFILEKGYGYKVDIVTGKEATMHDAIATGDIDVLMEYWLYDDKKPKHDEQVKADKIMDIKKIFQGLDGLWVPTYVIKGDSAKGIKPVAPDLKVVSDLKKYATVFKDPKDPSKGAIQFGAEAWESNKILAEKLKAHKLDTLYNPIIPKTEEGMEAYFAQKFEKSEPFIAYNYTPMEVAANYDMTFIEDDIAKGKDKIDVYITVNKSLEKKAPEAVEVLKKYNLTIDLLQKSLAEKKAAKSVDDYVKTFLKKNDALLTEWTTPAAAAAIKKALK